MPPWQAKAALQQIFSHLPSGHRVNYVFQRRVTHGLPVSDDSLRSSIATVEQHMRGLTEHTKTPISEGRFFEFGGGWDLHVPQALYCFGVEHQLVVDIRPLLHQDLVFDIRDRLQTIDVDLPLLVSGQISRSTVHGRLNGGGLPIHLRSGDGSIRIEAAD